MERQQEVGRLPVEGGAGASPNHRSADVALEAVALSETWLVFEQTMREVRGFLHQEQSITVHSSWKEDCKIHWRGG